MAERKPTIIDGTTVAARRLDQLRDRTKRRLTLGIITATDDPATRTYVGRKREAAERLGWRCRIVELPPTASQPEVLEAVSAFNDDPAVDAYIVQLPLPDSVDHTAVFSAVDPAKDADGLSAKNLEALYAGQPALVPATPRGILELLEAYDISVSGRKATVVGQGMLTGRPLAALLEQRGAEVTRADQSTGDLGAATRTADILVVATGNIDLITADMVKEGAVVIDVGINQLQVGITGDVDFDSVKRKASAITPVPGGVGPMTVVSLLENVSDIAKNSRSGGRSSAG